MYTIVLSSRICQFFCPGLLRCVRDRWRSDKAAIIVHTHAVSSVVVEIDMGGKLKHTVMKSTGFTFLALLFRSAQSGR